MRHTSGVYLRDYGIPIKVIDTHVMAKVAGVRSSDCPNIGLCDLLLRFNVCIAKIHTAGCNAAGTLMAAILLARQDIVNLADKGAPQATIYNRNIKDVAERVMAIG
jgi:hypothetical protein